ncbi:hypothetical protein ACFVGN_31340, partial [Streptomyces sp. NPDC057757]|uniref:hypothetical protein n=1 Tax=Streptomyces sp. NPDC057757 TaxID=3346241 RepID=UPI0036B0CE6F
MGRPSAVVGVETGSVQVWLRVTAGTADRAASQPGLCALDLAGTGGAGVGSADTERVAVGLSGADVEGADEVATGVGDATASGSVASMAVVGELPFVEEVSTVSAAGGSSEDAVVSDRVRTGVGAESSPGSPSVAERRLPTPGEAGFGVVREGSDAGGGAVERVGSEPAVPVVGGAVT